MAITQADIERAYGPGGTEGTNYTVTVSTDGDVHTVEVTDDDDEDARVTYGRSLEQAQAFLSAATGDPLNLTDNIDTARRIRLPSIALGTSGALVIDAAGGDHQYATLTADVTSVSLINPPAAGVAQWLYLVLEQGGAGGFTLPVSAWTGVDWWRNVNGVPEMPPNAGETLFIPIYMNGDVPIVIGDWQNNE